MKISMILFDLDGTLLPMDQNAFMKDYFGRLARRLAPVGYEPKALIDAIWAGTADMVKNDGSMLNEARFWHRFQSIFGEDAIKDLPLFDAFYREEFDEIKASCGYHPAAAQTIHDIKAMGSRVALATNPLFPSLATECRIRWAGLAPEDFELYTTYENTCYCKPNPDYYLDVCRRLGVDPHECVMVGNDVDEDMIAEALGMKVFLLTDCLLNKSGKDISTYPHGSFEELGAFIRQIQ